MNRAVVQAGAGVVVFVLLAAASVFLTNELFKVTASDKPTVTFSVKDKSDNVVDISKLDFLNLVLAGPTTDYNGYTSEDVRKATAGGGQYTYTFSTPLPAML